MNLLKAASHWKSVRPRPSPAVLHIDRLTRSSMRFERRWSARTRRTGQSLVGYTNVRSSTEGCVDQRGESPVPLPRLRPDRRKQRMPHDQTEAHRGHQGPSSQVGQISGNRIGIYVVWRRPPAPAPPPYIGGSKWGAAPRSLPRHRSTNRAVPLRTEPPDLHRFENRRSERCRTNLTRKRSLVQTQYRPPSIQAVHRPVAGSPVTGLASVGPYAGSIRGAAAPRG
jgi:hypothetical protein